MPAHSGALDQILYLRIDHSDTTAGLRNGNLIFFAKLLRNRQDLSMQIQVNINSKI